MLDVIQKFLGIGKYGKICFKQFLFKAECSKKYILVDNKYNLIMESNIYDEICIALVKNTRLGISCQNYEPTYLYKPPYYHICTRSYKSKELKYLRHLNAMNIKTEWTEYNGFPEKEEFECPIPLHLKIEAEECFASGDDKRIKTYNRAGCAYWEGGIMRVRRYRLLEEYNENT